LGQTPPVSTDDFIVEPEILHWTEIKTPFDFQSVPRSELEQAVPKGARSVSAVVMGTDGRSLQGAECTLYLWGPDRAASKIENSTDEKGHIEFSFPPVLEPAALVVEPAGGYWSVINRELEPHQTVKCPPLPANGHLSWWHRRLGINNYDPSRGIGIKIGIVDTGLGNHPCLEHVTRIGSFNNGRLPADTISDGDPHGTHVCGIIGARPTNQGHFAGIAPGAEIFCTRAFPRKKGATQQDLAEAIDALVLEDGVHLINLSLGSNQESEILHDAIVNAFERGVLCVCASANSGGSVEWPAKFDECAAVSAIGMKGWGPPGTLTSGNLPKDPKRFGKDDLYLASFSNFGAELLCTGPGVGIISTMPAAYGMSDPFAAMDGTSMACPAVCASLAAILSASEDYKRMPHDKSKALKAKELLKEHCVTIGLDVAFEGSGLPYIR
jgi:subtilisin family serine protease